MFKNGVVAVTLSERNLLALLAQLHDPGRPAPALLRAPGDGEPGILVQPQSDAEHYTDREPGVMRASTERGIEKFPQHPIAADPEWLHGANEYWGTHMWNENLYDPKAMLNLIDWLIDNGNFELPVVPH